MLLAVGGPGSLAAEYNTPVVGYEVMEERTRFTVFKLWVEPKDLGDGWFVFRRYTDFLRLNRKLREIFPGLRLVLPPKKWFGDNFDPCFLEDRLLALQAYVTNITNHPDISRESCVREFFCLDSKPDTYDSMEASRAMCESLDQKVHNLKKKLKNKDAVINSLQAELTLMKTQQNTLIKGLKLECSVTAFTQSRNISSQTSSFKDNSVDHENLNISKVLGIHNVNVTLLHMMEKAFGKENVPVTQTHEKNLYSPSEISSQKKFECNGKSSPLEVNNLEEISNSETTLNNSKTLSKKIADLSISSDGGYQEEFSSHPHIVSSIHQQKAPAYS
ncbi:Sorting nexin-16 [Nymphon striatum]|nr:Sorting nexin-16 [Nymphon striatum]